MGDLAEINKLAEINTMPGRSFERPGFFYVLAPREFRAKSISAAAKHQLI
jgi:hypothetical protein